MASNSALEFLGFYKYFKYKIRPELILKFAKNVTFLYIDLIVWEKTKAIKQMK